MPFHQHAFLIFFFDFDRTGQVITPHNGITQFDVSVAEGDIVEILEQKRSCSWTLIRNPKLDSGEKDFQGLIPTECVVEIPYKPRYVKRENC